MKQSSLEREEIKSFVEFFLTEGGALAEEVGYVALPDEAYDLARENLEAGKVGTGFAGTPEIGLTVEALLARERTL